MDAKFRYLPPAKRFRAIQQHQQQLLYQQVHQSPKMTRDQENVDPSSLSRQLPAKKRKESRHIPLLSDNPFLASAVTTYCIPTKKRIWAFPPDFEIPITPLSPIDLNAQYKPVCFFNNQGKNRADLKEALSEPDQKVSGEKGVFNSDCCNQVEEEIEIKSEEEEELGKIGFRSSNCNQNPLDINDREEEEIQECAADDEEDDGIVCAICQSTNGDPKDPIVFCDGCDLMVHTTCYGNPLIREIPDGDWFCNQCLSSKTKAKVFSCCLCPNKGGAKKSTTDGCWAHVVCALFVPEVFFQDSDGREGIDCSRVPKGRWRRRCYVCEGTSGCAIECSEQKCTLAFHVTCGLSEDLCIEYREGNGKGDIVAGFCKKHTKLWEKQERTGKFKIVARDEQQ